MTPLKRQYKSLKIDANMMVLVKISYLMKKHFVYNDDIDALKHSGVVIGDFDNALYAVRNMIRKLKDFRKNLGKIKGE